MGDTVRTASFVYSGRGSQMRELYSRNKSVGTEIEVRKVRK